MKRLIIASLVILLCGTVLFTSSHGIPPESEAGEPETICFTDMSGDYLFIQNFSETERMARSLRDYLGDNSIQIQTAVPEDAVYYAESTWDPERAAALLGGKDCCVEAWDIFKNGEFQKTSYLAGRI